MKRLISVLIVIVLCLCAVSFPSLAAGPSSFVEDHAGLLSASEKDSLEEKAAEASQAADCGIYVITVDDYTDLGNYDLIEDALDYYYDAGNFGTGEDRSAAMLMLSMEERDFSFLCFGSAYQTLTDSDLDRITYSFLDDFSQDAWYNGFVDYIDETNYAMLHPGVRDAALPEELQVSAPTSAQRRPNVTTSEYVAGMLASLMIGVIAAMLVRGHYLAQMQSVMTAQKAEHFVSKSGLDLRVRSDHFSHSETARIYDPPAATHSGSVRSSGIRSSSGFRSSGRSGRSSGRSGKF